MRHFLFFPHFDVISDFIAGQKHSNRNIFQIVTSACNLNWRDFMWCSEHKKKKKKNVKSTCNATWPSVYVSLNFNFHCLSLTTVNSTILGCFILLLYLIYLLLTDVAYFSRLVDTHSEHHGTHGLHLHTYIHLLSTSRLGLFSAQLHNI